MKILAIVGSPRLKGNTDYLVEQALGEAAKLGAETEKLILSRYEMKPCLGHEDCASFETCLQQDDMHWILDRFCEADAVILATPVYYYNVSAQMKAFIDRNYFLYNHALKPKARAVGVIVVADSAGIEDTMHTLKLFINESLDVKKGSIFTVCGYAGRLGDAVRNLPLVEKARNLGRQMVESLTLNP